MFQGPYQSALKELVKFNKQYIGLTAMKCITTHKKVREIGGALEKTRHFPN